MITMRTTVALAAIAGGATIAIAQPVSPFTEDFESGLSGWTANNGTQTLATQGMNSFAQATSTLDSTGFGAVNLLSGNAMNGASGGAFIGDYTASNIVRVTADVRHGAAGPLTFALRLATAGNFPGAVILDFTPVFAGSDFTTISFELNGADMVIPEGPFNPATDIYPFIGNVQLLVAGDESLDGTQVTVDIDNIRVIPAPAGAGVLALAGLVATRRRR
ncbi:MAG: hypothetical protein CMJ31_00065 [Phycisphaerae bacterium]|nr:hypothetical protein [Phycisphaerae bacterium]